MEAQHETRSYVIQYHNYYVASYNAETQTATYTADVYKALRMFDYSEAKKFCVGIGRVRCFELLTSK